MQRCEESTEKELKQELEQQEKELEQEEEWIKFNKRAKEVRLEFASLDFSLIYNRWTVRMDKPYVLSEILSAGTKIGYLVDSHVKRVSFDQLDSKYVLLYFWFLPDHDEPIRCKPTQESIWDLEETLKLHREEFEVVFVALGNNEDVFHITFSPMPWLTIPHENQEARDYLQKEFGIPQKAYQRAVLFDPVGMVVSAAALALFMSYGPHGFPFTRPSIGELLDECYTLKKKIFVDKEMPSLTKLLGEHVIFSSSGEDKVPTSELERKIVGLYFFEPTRKGVQRTRQLLNVWNSLTDEKRDGFEIVIVNKAPYNISNAMAVFEKSFGLAIPWYKVGVCGKKLCLIFDKDSLTDGKAETDGEGDVIVLKPDRYQHLSYFAFNILLKYGSAACPFTLEEAVTLSKREKQNELVLGNFLSPEAPLCRGVSSAGSKEDSVDTTVSDLFGKRVLLLLAMCACYESGSFLPNLKRMYEKKATDDDFEIIYMSLDRDESPSSFPKSIRGMPWLVHSCLGQAAV